MAVIPQHPSRSALSATLSLAADPALVAWCRRSVSSLMAAWGVETHVQQAAVLILSELVSNAVQYGAAPIDVTLTLDRWGGTLTGQVEDAGDGWPCPRDRDLCDLAEGGRGLLLVGLMATRWGVTRCAGTAGKRVWWCQAVPHLGLEVR